MWFLSSVIIKSTNWKIATCWLCIIVLHKWGHANLLPPCVWIFCDNFLKRFPLQIYLILILFMYCYRVRIELYTLATTMLSRKFNNTVSFPDFFLNDLNQFQPFETYYFFNIDKDIIIYHSCYIIVYKL